MRKSTGYPNIRQSSTDTQSNMSGVFLSAALGYLLDLMSDNSNLLSCLKGYLEVGTIDSNGTIENDRGTPRANFQSIGVVLR